MNDCISIKVRRGQRQAVRHAYMDRRKVRLNDVVEIDIKGDMDGEFW